jgi:uncharacterized protein
LTSIASSLDLSQPERLLKDFRSPWWLPGGQLQTIWPARLSRRFEGAAPAYRRERWTTPDQDFVDADFVDAADPAAPWLVVFHGLEGSSASHYAQSLAVVARDAGLNFVLPHFRGCSGELNLAPRAYHSGDFEEVGWMLERAQTAAKHRLAAASPTPRLMAVGISLGGNALLRWAQEAGHEAARRVHAVAAICSPIDLTAAGIAIGEGFNRLVYTRMFLQTMKPRAMAKWDQHPGLFDRDRALAADDLAEFDDVFTGPLHGYRGVHDYWQRASAKPHLNALRVPALVVNARNDPFVPARSLPAPSDISNPFVTLWQPQHGGHVGFGAGTLPPGHVMTMPKAVVGWLQNQRVNAAADTNPRPRS